MPGVVAMRVAIMDVRHRDTAWWESGDARVHAATATVPRTTPPDHPLLDVGAIAEVTRGDRAAVTVEA
jgi:hypothetical protein